MPPPNPPGRLPPGGGPPPSGPPPGGWRVPRKEPRSNELFRGGPAPELVGAMGAGVPDPGSSGESARDCGCTSRCGKDEFYGTRSRSLQDPFGAWAPWVSDWNPLPFGQVTVGANATVRVVSYQIPNRCVGRCLSWGFDADDATAYQEIEWRLMVAETQWLFVPPLAQIASLSNRMPLHRNVGPGSVVAIDAINTSSNGRTVRAIMTGIQRPIDDCAPETQ